MQSPQEREIFFEDRKYHMTTKAKENQVLVGEGQGVQADWYEYQAGYHVPEDSRPPGWFGAARRAYASMDERQRQLREYEKGVRRRGADARVGI